MKITDEMVEAAAREHDREEAAMMGEPSPWDFDGGDFDDFKSDRMHSMRAALEAVAPMIRKAAMEEAAKIASDFLTKSAIEEGNTKTPRGRTAIYYERKITAAIRAAGGE